MPLQHFEFDEFIIIFLRRSYDISPCFYHGIHLQHLGQERQLENKPCLWYDISGDHTHSCKL